MKTLLTIITSGKNDNFAGNFLQRLEHNLNKLIENIDKMQINDVEIIVTDWGSDHNKRLFNVCEVPRREYLKFLYVPYHICKKYSPNSEFSLPHSLNSAIRRSNGNFIFYIDGDSYIPFNTFKKFHELLKSHDPVDDVYYWASRYLIPYKYQCEAKNTRDMDSLLDDWISKGKPLGSQYELAEKFVLSKIDLKGFAGGAMGLLISKKIAFETTFFYEELTRWGWMDVEFFKRMSSRYTCMGDLVDVLDCEFYHIGHHEVKTGHEVHGFNPFTSPVNFSANDQNWGLSNEDLQFN